MQPPDNELFLRILVPPLRLISAAAWQLIQLEDVPNYGLLEEFVSLLTDTVPDLLSYRQKTQLTMGLRARLVLELCRKERPDPDMVQANLRRIQNLIALHKELETNDTHVEESGANFLALVQIFMKDPAERNIFFKDVFPSQYGAAFNCALKKLMWLFLSRLENALPQPTMEQTAHMLSRAPTVMEDCVRSISQPQQLGNLFKYQSAASVEFNEHVQLWSATPDDCILSCLGSPQIVQVVIEEQTQMNSQSESLLDYPSYYEEVQVESAAIAQYDDSDPESSSNICEGNDIECFDTDESKDYKVQSLDQICTENGTEYVHEKVKSIDLRVVDFVLDDSSEKQDALKNEVFVEGLETVNCREDAPSCQENNRITKEKGDDHPEMELTQESSSNEICHITTSPEGNIISDDMKQESNEVFGLITSSLLKQSCVKLERLDMTCSPIAQPFDSARPKRGRGRPRKDTPNTKELFKEKQDRPMGEPCVLVNWPSEIQETQLQQHLIVCHTEENKSFCETEEEKTVHMNTSHLSGNQKPLTKIRFYRGVPVCKTCPVCEKTFTRSSDMRRHQASHTVARPFTCLYCGKTFRYSFDLRRHQQNVCANQGYVVLDQSETCDITDSSSGHSPISSPTNVLPSCPVKQSTSKQDTVFCRVCRITLSNSSALESHMETHSKGILHTCPCGKTYKYIENMRTHQLVCPASDLHKHEQKQCDEHDAVKDIEFVLHDRGPQDSPKVMKSFEEPDIANPESTSNESSASAAVSSSDQMLQVPHKQFESLEQRDSGIPEPIHGSETRRKMRISSGALPHKCSQCGDSFKYSYSLKKHEDICEVTKNPMGSGEGSKEYSRSSTVSSNFKTTGVATCVPLDPLLKETFCTENVEGENEEWKANEAQSLRAMAMFTCGKDCKDPHSLKQHKVCNNKEQRYKCVKCASLFRTLLEVRKHVHTHWGEDPLQCSHCGKYFQSSSQLSKHKVVHEVDRNYPCTQCLDTFEQLDSLKQHYLEIHKFMGPYQCPHCDKTLTDLGSMVVHVRTHNDERPYQCSHCSKRFKHRSGLNVHEKLHSGHRPFLCEECGKCFSSKIQLQRHLVSHSNERPYECPECNKCFKSQHVLRGHLLNHSKPTNIPCEFCGKVFSQISALDRHHRTHTGERPYSCPKCGKTFLTSGEVGKHMRYHTGERPFQCSLCSKTFTQTCYLTAHMRIHTGERPYVCSVCEKGFVCNTHLKRHMFVHTKEKPFKCDCGKAFNRTSLLRVHQNTQCFLQNQ